MARKTIDIGTIGNDGTGDSIRDSFRKVNDNFKELYGSLGLGERLTFKELSDSPAESYDAFKDDGNTKPLVTINNTSTGLAYKKLVAGAGISINFDANPSEIQINNTLNTLSSLTENGGALGGDITARPGGGTQQWTIKNLPEYNRLWTPGDPGAPGGPTSPGEVTSKSYIDSFVSRAGVNHVDPATGQVNAAFGRMNGPLVLSRDPNGDDDELYDGLIAATKRYVDGAAAGSVNNIFISTSGSDDRGNLSLELQGSSLSYAYRTIEAGLKKAEKLISEAKADIGPYKKVLTYNSNPDVTKVPAYEPSGTGGTCRLDYVVVSPDSGTGFDGAAIMSADTVTLIDGGQLYAPGDILEILGGSSDDPSTLTDEDAAYRTANNISNTKRVSSPVKILVLATASTPGAITSFRVLSTGSYSVLPEYVELPFDVANKIGRNNGIPSEVVVKGGPPEFPFGQGAFFDIRYKVSNVKVTNPGNNYGLVSVRIEIPEGGEGTSVSDAFGTADVVDGEIVSITVTDQGSGFDVIPEVLADLPRFCIYTGDRSLETPPAQGGYRTDYTGDVINSNRKALLSRDIRPGLYLKGEKSGAIAQILTHRGELGDSTGEPAQDHGYSQEFPGPTDLYELFDVDVISGRFIEGEPISYGDTTITKQVSVLIESGIYEENYPLKIPRNVAIIGDEFRRVLIKPKSGMSSSPWAFNRFRRDRTIGSTIETLNVDDVLVISDTIFGYHYLTDSSKPVWPKISNRGLYRAGPELLLKNRSFLQEEVVSWIDKQINPDEGQSSGIWENFEYNRSICRRDIGLIIDAMIFDLQYGESNRTISATLKYAESTSSIKAITNQKNQSIASIEKLNELMQQVLANTPITNSNQESILQVIDPAFQTETLVYQIVEDLTGVITGIIEDLYTLIDAGWTSGDPLPAGLPPNFRLNPPLANNEMDIFLVNDANIIRAVTCQGHGGFMMVLDPTGQILTKSPYAQESASFSRSIDQQTFAGGMFVDGFTGNLQFKHNDSIYNLVSATVNNAGSGYSESDELILDSGTYTRPAKIRILSVGGGGSISSFTLIDRGSYSELPGSSTISLTYPAGSSGSGTSASLDCLFGASRLGVSGLDRFPQLPSSFLVNDDVYRINYVRDFIYDPAGSTATLVLDDTTPFAIDPGAVTFTVSTGSTTVINKSEHRLQPGATLVFFAEGGALPTGLEEDKEYYVLVDGLGENEFKITDVQGSITPISFTGPGTGTLKYQRIYEILTPGNRSMLANDFTQVNDYGYGLVATNGGLLEAVSVFTYYCWVSYYSINGGQIRSVSGSSAHGKYALVAQGSDPLEVPTPTGFFEELSQGVTCYAASAAYENTAGGFLIWVRADKYIPLVGSELEIDHGDEIKIYDVGGVSTEDLPIVSGKQVVRLNLSTQDGLLAQVANNTRMTLRCNSRVILTGDLLDVAVRPSTGLILNDRPELVYRVLQFSEYSDPRAPYAFTVTGGLFTATSTPHRLREGFEIRFSVSAGGSLPTGLNSTDTYYVLSNNLNANTGTFKISTIKNGDPLNINGSTGSGIYYFEITGLTETQLRENYEYTRLTVFEPGVYVGNFLTGDGTCTFSLDTSPSTAGDIIVTKNSHGLSIGSVVKFRVSTGGTLPSPMSLTRKYHVISTGFSSNQFKISLNYAGAALKGVDTGSGTFYYGKLLGSRPGTDTRLPIIGLGSDDARIVEGSKFVFLGNEYTITDYTVPDDQVSGSEIYGIITFTPALVAGYLSPLQYSSQLTLKAGSPVGSYTEAPGTAFADGTLTVRISLTRVTGHDLLEIGSGSYKETNYPNEIYGSAENPLDARNETQERGVGRTFYVTTDQYGNFNVGPFFRVDQGTGTVTFSSSIAISNLSGLGFKRGVTVTEFSTDTSFGGGESGALDKVPVEFATRAYIERRLGIRHTGAIVPDAELIPATSGGFLSLDGQLTMKGNLKIGNYKITGLADPSNDQDAVNKRYLKFSNLNDLTLTPSGSPGASQLLAFTGSQTNMVNITVSGDLSAGTISSNSLPITIVNGAVTNAKVSASAAIAQSKLSMNVADTFVESTGWTGAKTQADLGLSKFSANNFETSGGFVRIKDNGIVLAELQQIATGTVLGNNSGVTGNVSAISFATIADSGGSVKKSQYSSIGFLRRTNATSFSNDSDYTISTASSTNTVNALVERDNNGDFSTRRITLDQLNVGVGASSNAAIIRTTAGTAGNIRYYGWGEAAGIIVGNGANSTDRVTKYLNDSHTFRNLADTAAAPIIASSIQVGAITTGGSTTAGTITGRWTLTGTSPSESRLQATYSADLAEYYEGDKEYEIGTVLVFGGDKEVTTTNQHGDTRVAGVVSNTAAFVMYDACPGLKNLIALQGRVPCKVVGSIRKGDILVTSKIPGVAIATKTAQAGTIVGKALENYDSDHIGTIEVAVGRN